MSRKTLSEARCELQQNAGIAGRVGFVFGVLRFGKFNSDSLSADSIIKKVEILGFFS